jgi:hypothetical protein
LKLSNWQQALDEYIAAAHTKPFSYDRGEGLDCCTFTFGAIRAQTGRVIGAQFAGVYTTHRQALITMKLYCGRPSLSAAIAKLMREHEFSPVPPLYAQRGDAVLAPQTAGGDFLGILDLNGRDVLSVGDDGVRRVPISIRCRAWRIT